MELTYTMQVAILLMSLGNAPEYHSTVAAIKTMDVKNCTWVTVTTRLIEEQKQVITKIVTEKEDATPGIFSIRHKGNRKTQGIKC